MAQVLGLENKKLKAVVINVLDNFIKLILTNEQIWTANKGMEFINKNKKKFRTKILNNLNEKFIGWVKWQTGNKRKKLWNDRQFNKIINLKNTEEKEMERNEEKGVTNLWDNITQYPCVPEGVDNKNVVVKIIWKNNSQIFPEFEGKHYIQIWEARQ